MLLTAVQLLADGVSSFHGYPLAQAMRGGSQMNYATLYRCLDRLEQRGYLSSDWKVPQDSAQARRVYEVTGAGISHAATIETDERDSVLRISDLGT